MRSSRPFVLLLLLALPASAIELSLEENRAERGNIGYIDMQKVFKLFPETQRAKENFEEAVRQTEEQVNLRKAELLRLRAELSQMKSDREVLAAAPPPAVVVSSAAQEAPAPEKPASAPPAPPAKIVAPPADAAMAASESRPELDTVPASTQAAIAGLPGFDSTTAPVSGQAPAAPPQTPALTAPAPPAAAAPAMPAPPAPTPLELIDGRIAQKIAEISQKEEEYKQNKSAAEKNLLDLESRKSELLLGKIYKAVQEVARKEGVSVVVDKGAILYGHNAVDLTDKVLKHLKGA